MFDRWRRREASLPSQEAPTPTTPPPVEHVREQAPPAIPALSRRIPDPNIARTLERAQQRRMRFIAQGLGSKAQRTTVDLAGTAQEVRPTVEDWNAATPVRPFSTLESTQRGQTGPHSPAGGVEELQDEETTTYRATEAALAVLDRMPPEDHEWYVGVAVPLQGGDTKAAERALHLYQARHAQATNLHVLQRVLTGLRNLPDK